MRQPGNAEIRGLRTDLTQDEEIDRVVKDADLVIGAVPGEMGFRTVERVVTAGRSIVDISFFPEDPFLLDHLAKSKGVTVVVDAGVAPGLSNLQFGHFESTFDRVDRMACFVGGLPESPTTPWNYRAPFSPVDVIEEHTRPVRLRRDGKTMVLPALSEPDYVEFSGVGRLEAFKY